MLFVICLLFITAFHDVSSLKCYKCDANRVDSWIDVNNLPPFMDDCPLVEASKQCTSSIRWLTVSTLKETLVEYEDDADEEDRPINSSLSYTLARIGRDVRSASKRLLLYSCTTDKCNDRKSLLRAFQALTLEENFAPLDDLFDNGTTAFTEQSSCLDFSNSTNTNCPQTAAPLVECSNCFLLSMESPREICARCPADSGKDNNMVHRQVYFFLENRTRLADLITLRCRTIACNSLDTWNRIRQLSKLEFDFNKFYSSSSSSIFNSTFFLSLNIVVLFIHFYKLL